MSLPLPDEDALAHSQKLCQHLATQIQQAGGWISFADFMQALLYAPNLGYYTAGARKFGEAGDFITAPELSPLFAQALANQVAQILAESRPHILEVGAGSGRLAVNLLLALEANETPLERYDILDLSADLRERQRQLIEAEAPHLLHKVQWLDTLPEAFSGCIIGNEVLDAMPAPIVIWQENTCLEKGVALSAQGFSWETRPASGKLLELATQIGEEYLLPPGYESEISLANRAWSAEWGHRLQQGALLLLDYGFPRKEYYHPQRGRGTLMCHYRHHAHPDPFYLPGLQDVTVHVDFTAIIEAADSTGLSLLGYANQGQFLINCGILDALASIPQSDQRTYLQASSQIAKLLMPHEMGELFKVMALGRNINPDLMGFRQGEQSHKL